MIHDAHEDLIDRVGHLGARAVLDALGASESGRCSFVTTLQRKIGCPWQDTRLEGRVRSEDEVA